MRSRGWLLALLVPFLLAPAARGQGVPYNSYQLDSSFLPQTPSVTGGATGAFFNPAAWGTAASTEFAVTWDERDLRPGSLDDWGVSVGRNVGFSSRTVTLPGPGAPTLRTTQLGLSGGDDLATVGLAWQWLSGDAADALRRDDGLVFGIVSRPAPWLTYGGSMVIDDFLAVGWGMVDVGIRPFGTPVLTLYGDASWARGQSLRDTPWGAGFEVRPLRGLHVGATARGFDGDVSFGVNLGVTLDDVGIHALPQYDTDGDHVSTPVLLRMNPPHRGMPLARSLRTLGEPKRIIPVSLENKRVTYRRSQWFDERRVAWSDLLATLDRIQEEPSAAGVALNLSGTEIRPSVAWELRRKLGELRAAGKTVYVHGDRMGQGLYYVASVADRVQLDPQGNLLIPGLAAHRTYVKGFLEKVGIGSEEWRIFTHKTAFQTYARKDMSDADREQLGRLIDVIYETWRADITASRGLTDAAYDAVVNDDVWMSPRTARARGLIDAEGRWDDLKDWIGKETDTHLAPLPNDPDLREHSDERWGGPREIAVVYQLGPTQMDSGIRARAAAKHLAALGRRPNLAGVVIRVDSPGGDPLASDLVARGIRDLKRKGIPVIVSQGDVAASGGYWVSMDADTVLTTPVTVTGSIGVILGWFWDEGFSEKTGFTADGVQRGEHADLFTGIRPPFLPLPRPLPERNLTPDEVTEAERLIREEYDTFVAGVARGRGLSEERVREIGEGRIWMGEDALERDLVDAIGGLGDALALVRTRAGIDDDEQVRILEWPERPLFTWPRFLPDVPGIRALAWSVFGSAPGPADETEEPGYEWIYTRTLAAGAGYPQVLLPPDVLPAEWWTAP